MKKWYGGAVVASLFMLLLLRYGFMKNPVEESYLMNPFSSNGTNPLEWEPLQGRATVFAHLEFVEELNYSFSCLPNGVEAIKEAGSAWNSLMASVEEEKLGYVNDNSSRKAKEKQCPQFLNKMNATETESHYKLRVPCGLTQGSSIIIIGIPNGVLVIVQNTWTLAHDWGEEERCPPETSEKNNKVDELDQCNKFVVKDDNLTSRIGGNTDDSDGKHVTSFAYRETLEPWLVSEFRISGDVKLISVLASGLPTSEDSDHTVDIETLKSVPLSLQRPVDLFIGVFSTANNFKRRMAVRRTWMQYPEVRSGTAVVRFFVGLHKNHIVNDELWNEARTYGDVQLMPFVDYYSLITWKTLAICTFGVKSCSLCLNGKICSFLKNSSLLKTEVVSGKFVMKTDDDAFVRLDEVMASLSRINVTHGLLYGLINSDSQPHRSTDSKWYISPEEWSEERYPPWAHGPGYVVSHDIAKAVYKRFNEVRLKMFKLEDVAMGIWIADMIKDGLEVRYEKEERIFNEGCKDGYVIAHYQGPREMMCLWQKLQETKRARCCGDR
ncbi:Beta-1,3-galactosyltransferase 15 [Hibiscus syriacus]|uniref:Beta-1,3-galactosyltransferase 15 n=1 Tax=Hibiscus syriacus TaxID=106335 RepID=A0A6A2X5U3_HIBSY|nr:Beta-1,3-galactosyltransferase 15 [Hibiscus syriacus]